MGHWETEPVASKGYCERCGRPFTYVQNYTKNGRKRFHIFKHSVRSGSYEPAELICTPCWLIPRVAPSILWFRIGVPRHGY